jgi:hypothetical protein
LYGTFYGFPYWNKALYGFLLFLRLEEELSGSQINHISIIHLHLAVLDFS